MSEQRLSAAEIDEAIQKAEQEIFALAKGPYREGGKSWRMCVPVDPDDSDVVLMRACRAADQLRRDLTQARRERDEALTEWRFWYEVGDRLWALRDSESQEDLRKLYNAWEDIRDGLVSHAPKRSMDKPQ